MDATDVSIKDPHSGHPSPGFQQIPVICRKISQVLEFWHVQTWPWQMAVSALLLLFFYSTSFTPWNGCTRVISVSLFHAVIPGKQNLKSQTLSVSNQKLMFTFQINHNEAVEKILQPHKGNKANVPKSFQRHIFGENVLSSKLVEQQLAAASAPATGPWRQRQRRRGLLRVGESTFLEVHGLNPLKRPKWWQLRFAYGE